MFVCFFLHFKVKIHSNIFNFISLTCEKNTQTFPKIKSSFLLSLLRHFLHLAICTLIIILFIQFLFSDTKHISLNPSLPHLWVASLLYSLFLLSLVVSDFDSRFTVKLTISCFFNSYSRLSETENLVFPLLGFSFPIFYILCW